MDNVFKINLICFFQLAFQRTNLTTLDISRTFYFPEAISYIFLLAEDMIIAKRRWMEF